MWEDLPRVRGTGAREGGMWEILPRVRLGWGGGAGKNVGEAADW